MCVCACVHVHTHTRVYTQIQTRWSFFPKQHGGKNLCLRFEYWPRTGSGLFSASGLDLEPKPEMSRCLTQAGVGCMVEECVRETALVGGHMGESCLCSLWGVQVRLHPPLPLLTFCFGPSSPDLAGTTAATAASSWLGRMRPGWGCCCCLPWSWSTAADGKLEGGTGGGEVGLWCSGGRGEAQAWGQVARGENVVKWGAGIGAKDGGR